MDKQTMCWRIKSPTCPLQGIQVMSVSYFGPGMSSKLPCVKILVLTLALWKGVETKKWGLLRGLTAACLWKGLWDLWNTGLFPFLSFHFLAAMMWITCSTVYLPPWYAALPQTQKQWGQPTWTGTSKTISHYTLSSFLSWFISGV
jgi:hypothetical protein